MKQFKAMIFDFNGVLWWDSHLHEAAWIKFTTQLLERPATQEELQQHFHGRTNSYIIEYCLGRKPSSDEIATYTEMKEGMYRQMCLELGDEMQLSPGAIDFLDFIVAHKIPHTIATASEKNNLDFFVKEFKLSRWFAIDSIVYDDLTFPGKPDPTIYRKAAAALRLDPADCVVIEDSQSGMQAAHAAGIGFIIALGSQDKHDELQLIPYVDLVVSRVDQIPKDLFIAAQHN